MYQFADVRSLNKANTHVPISPTHEPFGDVPADPALMLQDQGSIAACCAARCSCLHGQDGDGIMLACCSCSGPPSGLDTDIPL